MGKSSGSYRCIVEISGDIGIPLELSMLGTLGWGCGVFLLNSCPALQYKVKLKMLYPGDSQRTAWSISKLKLVELTDSDPPACKGVRGWGLGEGLEFIFLQGQFRTQGFGVFEFRILGLRLWSQGPGPKRNCKLHPPGLLYYGCTAFHKKFLVTQTFKVKTLQNVL